MRKTIIICGLLVIGVYLLLQTNLIPWQPSHGWHLEGKVYDEATNAVPGVDIVADGHVRWTLLNLFFGTGPRTFRTRTTSAQDGGFALACTASDFGLVFRKAAYAERKLVFTASGDRLWVQSEDGTLIAEGSAAQEVELFLTREHGRAEKK